MYKSAIRWLIRRNIRRLNASDYRPALAMFASDAVLSSLGTILGRGSSVSQKSVATRTRPIDVSLLDDQIDIAAPEALAYELDHNGDIAGLVAHEYIVPVDGWTAMEPPTLFGQDFHQHSTLPLWILHTWIWKDNPAGVFTDYNPRVRLCPAGVPIFGVDLPAE
jgi:hypothetical protein